MELKVHKTDGSVKVSTVIGNYLGVITGVEIRQNAVYTYEVSYFVGSEYRNIKMYPKEIKIIGDVEHIKVVGYKTNG